MGAHGEGWTMEYPTARVFMLQKQRERNGPRYTDRERKAGLGLWAFSLSPPSLVKDLKVLWNNQIG